MWNGDPFLQQLYEEMLSRHEAQRKIDPPHERKAKLKDALCAAIGTFETNEAFEPRLLERVDCGDYIRERVELSAVPGLSFAAYVLLPKHTEGGQLPGVLALHGHGYGSREIVGLLQDGASDEAEPGIHQHFALQLVKRGLAVIAPDVIGFGERKLLAEVEANPDIGNSCFRLSTQLMMLGKTLTGLRVTEALKAFDYLAGRSEINSDRIGIMGFSGGGLISYVTSVLDARIRATVLTGITNTFKESIFAINHCIDNYTPGLLAHAELPELIGLIAPRPLFLESGENDRIFPVGGFRKAAAEIQAIYEAEGAADQVQTDVFPGTHEISGRIAYDWLRNQLRYPPACTGSVSSRRIF